jgi:hypothetical protein
MDPKAAGTCFHLAAHGTVFALFALAVRLAKRHHATSSLFAHRKAYPILALFIPASTINRR